MSNDKRSLVIPQETMQMIGKAVRDTYKAELRDKVAAQLADWGWENRDIEAVLSIIDRED